MVYVMSDLHGRYDLYKKMLELIALKPEDKLYILGDFVDRGDDGFKIIFDIEDNPQIIPLIGNHDFLAAVLLSRINKGMTAGERADLIGLINSWLLDGGRATFDAFKALSPAERKHALSIMGDFRNATEITVGDKTFVLCHGGISNFDPKKPITDYEVEDLIFHRTDYSKTYYPDKYLVTGHTPTACIEGAEKGRIYRSGMNIAVDCGAVFDYGLGCIRLDDFEEFYVK